MAYADDVLKDNIKTILEGGITDDGFDVRPHWKDGTPAHTVYTTDVINRYDLSEGQFPLTTLRPVAWKSGLREILWIYQDQSNDVEFLSKKYDVHYWDSWKNASGDLGKAYGYQIGKVIKFPEGEFNQIDRVLYLLKNDPMNRRIMTTMIDMEEMVDMTLVPCAFMTLWSVRKGFLDMSLIQRSNDLVAAQSINVTQYAFLLMMVAQATGYKPGRLVHFIQNMHIYDRHLPVVEEMLTRQPMQQATVTLNPAKTNFYNFVDTDFTIEGYGSHPNIGPLEIAI